VSGARARTASPAWASRSGRLRKVAAADARDITYGNAGGTNGLPDDDRWKIREFAADELAELEAIRSGRLLSLYVGPGNFV
jgi:hypothetical protein